jgi:DNA-binding MarR family transcriptional regulator
MLLYNVTGANEQSLHRISKEGLNMVANLERDSLVLRLWSLLHRVRDVLMRCEDERFGHYGITSEQFGVLVTLKYIGESARPTDIARWIGRSPNSVSMILDRMAKAGLVRRVRSRKDRREVTVIMTSKAESALKPAAKAGLEFIQKVMSPLLDEDLSTLIQLLEIIRHGGAECLGQGVTIDELRGNDITSQRDLMKRLKQYTLSTTPRTKRQGGKKGKTTR